MTRTPSIPCVSLFAYAERLEEQAQSWKPSLFWEWLGGCDETVEIQSVRLQDVFQNDKFSMNAWQDLSAVILFLNRTSHKLIQVYPLPDRITDTEVVTIAGECVRRAEWLAGLRKE